MFRKGCTEEIQHIGDAWGEKERRALRNEGSPLAPQQRPLTPAPSWIPHPISTFCTTEGFNILPKGHSWVTRVRAPPGNPSREGCSAALPSCQRPCAEAAAQEICT